MFFARKAAVVSTCEPNPWNYARSAEGVKLNQLANVRVFNPALSSKPSELEIGGRSADAWFRPMRNSRGRFENAESNADSNDSGGYARFGCGAAWSDSVGFPQDRYRKLELEALRGMRHTLPRRGPDLFIELLI
jgi:hypothetical protein